MNMILVENTGCKVYMAEIMEDDSFEIEKLKLKINDPCYAIFRFKNTESPLPNLENCAELLAWYNQICKMDDFDHASPGELMIGKQFYVMCWKNTQLEDCTNAKASVTYAAEIIDCHGFGTDGFFIEELGMNVDTAVFALNHFIIA